MNDFFHIEYLGAQGLWVIILSTEMTSTYWKELENVILQNHWANMDVHFDFLYRNGFENRFYKAHLGEGSRFTQTLRRCNVIDAHVTDRFFTRNTRLLEGSVLSSIQRNMYIKTIFRHK